MFQNLLNRLRGKPKRTPQETRQKMARRSNKNISHDVQKNFSVVHEENNFFSSLNENISYDMQKNFSVAHEENNFSVPMNENVINVKNIYDWQKIFDKLNNLNGFEEFLNSNNFSWVKIRIDRVREELEKMKTPENFDDEDLNFNLAKKIKSVAIIMLEIFSDCNKSTNLDEITKQKLNNLVENYLTALGIKNENFSAGDSFDDWAELSMERSFLTVSTNDRNLHNKIKDVEIQPHIIFYISDVGEVDKFIFGGMCSVYKFKEG